MSPIEQLDAEQLIAIAEREAWEPILDRVPTTPEQRIALYRFKMPKSLVKSLDREQAIALQRLLVSFARGGIKW